MLDETQFMKTSVSVMKNNLSIYVNQKK